MQSKHTPLRVNIMTASLTAGDAIGNYILMCADILRGWGVKVHLFADAVAPELGMKASLSEHYHATGQGILWYHYSIYSENIAIAAATHDALILDYHGITPPHLFAKTNPHLQQLCQRGIDMLPQFAERVDAAIVHSTFTERELGAIGFDPSTIHRVPLAVDLTKFDHVDVSLEERLAAVPYLLFVGRIVPQKDMIAMIDLFAAVHAHHPQLRLFLVGSHALVPAYKRQIDRRIAHHRLTDQVDFFGQINNPSILSALFKQAQFYCALSEWESFCVPIAEALYFGTPAIVSDTPPLPEVAGATAIVVDKANMDGAAQQITQLLDDQSAYHALRQDAEAFGQQYRSAALAQNILNTFKTIWLHA